MVEEVWKINFDAMTNVVDVYIYDLRRESGTLITSEPTCSGHKPEAQARGPSKLPRWLALLTVVSP
jgi:hypothetical protein